MQTLTKQKKQLGDLIMNKKFNSLSLSARNLNGQLADLKQNSKLKVQLKTKAEIQIDKTFQLSTKENNIIEWKADQKREIRIIC